MLLKSALLGAACALAFAGDANANGWYGSIELGANWIADADVQWDETSAGLLVFSTDTEARFDTGWALIAALGYQLQHWRIELELGWRSNDKDRFDALLVSTGDLDELTGMYNMAYAFPLSPEVSLSLGGGAGFDYAMLDIVNADDGNFSFAYQGIVSLNYALSPDVALTLNYRYLHVLDPEFKDTSAGIGEFYTFDDLSKHAVTLGVRYTFAP